MIVQAEEVMVGVARSLAVSLRSGWSWHQEFRTFQVEKAMAGMARSFVAILGKVGHGLRCS